ncbi:MAG: TRAP transporter small permease subunit [Lawsonibacter sp.]
MEHIKKIQSVIAKISLAASAILLVLVAAALFINVLDRFIFRYGLMWVEMFSRYGLIWSVFLAANVLIYKNELMRVDFLDSFWPKQFIRVREIIYTGIFILMLALLIYFGMEQALAYVGVAILGLPMDKFWIYLSIPVGAVLMLIQYLFNLLSLFLTKKGGDDPA